MLFLLAWASAAQANYGANLVVNGNAESVPHTGTAVTAFPGWTSDGNVSILSYGVGSFLATTDPGPTDRGNNFFYGGQVALSAASQSIDLSFAAADIDAGNARFNLSAWLGGFSSQDDAAVISVNFYDAAMHSLGTSAIGPVLSADRAGKTELLLRTVSASVPANARSATVKMTFTRQAGSDNDGYVDDVSLVLVNANNTGQPPYALSVTNAGTGSGAVTSADGGINCGSTCNASYNSATSVTLTASPASGSTFTGWSGACTGTGTCTVTMNAAMSVTATFSPAPFVVQTTGVTAGIITAPVATVITTVSFNTADKGKPQSVFITAWVPSNTLSKAQQASIASYTTMVKPLGTSASTTFVLVQLTQSGWQPVVNGQLIPYVTGVTSEQTAAVKILDNTSTANLLGSQFCVGYGTSAADMASNGRMQLVATVANSNAKSANTGSCNVALPISDARAFAYAESNYTNFFWGVYTADKIDYQGNHFDYRYYPVTQNYLAVDTSGVVWVLGPVSGGIIQSVGPLENFRSVITTWEGTQPQ